jgi:DNA-binding MarR family transcriptional regulator
MLFNRYPGASIGVPAGRESGFFVLDVDSLAVFEKLEKEHGKLPVTLMVRTPSGGLHIYFEYVEGVTNSPGGLPKGLDVRGQGGYVLVPPSPGYEIESRSPIAEAPGWLLDLILSRRRDTEGEGHARSQRVEVPEGEPVLEGGRNNALFWGCLDQSQRGASPAEVEGWGLAFNETRCVPPQDEAAVIRTARSAAGYPLRRKGVSQEVEEIIENAWRDWFENMLPGGGRSKLRDCSRVLLEFGGRFGEFIEVIIEGEVRRAVAVSVSARQGALPAATSHMTFSRSMRRLEEEGKVLRGTEERKEEDASTWLILEPATKCYTPTSTTIRDVRGVTLSREPLQTPCFRWRGLVGNTGGGVLVTAERWGPQTADELAERLGWSRKRDLKTRHLDRLVELGLLEEERGIYRIPGDYRQRVEEVRSMRYTTIRRRKRESHDGPRKVVWVEEVESSASESEREEKDRQRYAEQRRRFREALERKKAGEELPPEVVDLLQAWAEERGEGWEEAA